MNSATWILIGESFLILVVLVIAMAVYTWRKKRRLLTALDVLVTNLSEAEQARKSTLTERLKNSCQVDEAKAKLLSDEIFSAERQFTQMLIQLLLNPETDKIAEFNGDIYTLLTPYWELLSLDRMAEGLPAEQLTESTAALPVSPESESGEQLNKEDDLEVSAVAEAAEDLEAESASTLTDSTSDIEIDEDDVVALSEIADQSTPVQDPNESDQNQETSQSMSVPLTEENTTGKGIDDASAVPTEGEPAQKSEAMEPGDSEGDESFPADTVEDKHRVEETTGGVETEEEGDEPSWGDAFDEAAQEQEEARVINLDENDYDDGKSKKVPEL